MRDDQRPLPGMSADQKRRVRESYDSIREMFEPVTLLFYGRLFELDPSARWLFHHDLAQQGRKLADTLTAIVESLDHFDTMTPRLVILGRQHAAYGVRPEQYAIVTTALLWALGQAIGPDFDAATREAWRAALAAVSTVMCAAASYEQPPGPESVES